MESALLRYWEGRIFLQKKKVVGYQKKKSQPPSPCKLLLCCYSRARICIRSLMKFNLLSQSKDDKITKAPYTEKRLIVYPCFFFLFWREFIFPHSFAKLASNFTKAGMFSSTLLNLKRRTKVDPHSSLWRVRYQFSKEGQYAAGPVSWLLVITYLQRKIGMHACIIALDGCQQKNMIPEEENADPWTQIDQDRSE